MLGMNFRENALFGCPLGTELLAETNASGEAAQTATSRKRNGRGHGRGMRTGRQRDSSRRLGPRRRRSEAETPTGTGDLEMLSHYRAGEEADQ